MEEVVGSIPTRSTKLMQWLLQVTGLPDTQNLKMLEALQARGLKHFGIGIIPFEHTVLGLEETDPQRPSFFYGSTVLVEVVSKWDTYRPGVFWNKEWWDPRYPIDKRSDMLNREMTKVTVSDLRARWVTELTFAKSIDPKNLTGMVLEPCKQDHDDWLIEHSWLDGAVELVLAPALEQKIESEWRFFILDGKVVTGSSYRWLGARRTNLPLTDALQTAVEASKSWLPAINVVMDICFLRDGSYRVVEFNCINSSGFYNSDVGAIVDHFENLT
jgi:hypothetical protein